MPHELADPGDGVLTISEACVSEMCLGLACLGVGRPQGGVCTAEVVLNAPLCAFLSIMGAPSSRDLLLQQEYVLLGLSD